MFASCREVHQGFYQPGGAIGQSFDWLSSRARSSRVKAKRLERLDPEVAPAALAALGPRLVPAMDLERDGAFAAEDAENFFLVVARPGVTLAVKLAYLDAVD